LDPVQASARRPYGYPALQGKVGLSGLKAGVSNRKGSSDEVEEVYTNFRFLSNTKKRLRCAKSNGEKLYTC
jgi:hypothetical protein